MRQDRKHPARKLFERRKRKGTYRRGRRIKRRRMIRRGWGTLS
jgi:hypothetical protein